MLAPLCPIHQKARKVFFLNPITAANLYTFSHTRTPTDAPKPHTEPQPDQPTPDTPRNACLLAPAGVWDSAGHLYAGYVVWKRCNQVFYLCVIDAYSYVCVINAYRYVCVLVAYRYLSSAWLQMCMYTAFLQICVCVCVRAPDLPFFCLLIKTGQNIHFYRCAFPVCRMH